MSQCGEARKIKYQTPAGQWAGTNKKAQKTGRDFAGGVSKAAEVE